MQSQTSEKEENLPVGLAENPGAKDSKNNNSSSSGSSGESSSGSDGESVSSSDSESGSESSDSATKSKHTNKSHTHRKRRSRERRHGNNDKTSTRVSFLFYDNFWGVIFATTSPYSATDGPIENIEKM